MDNRELYESYGGNYSETDVVELNNLSGRDSFVVNTLKSRFLNSDSTKSILEMSIGNPIFSRALLSTSESISLTCADISEPRINYYESTFSNVEIGDRSNISFIKCNFDTDLEKINECEFDSIIALDVLEHVFDVFGFVDNCYRMIKSNGILILRVPNLAYIKHRFGLLFGYLPITSSWFGSNNSLDAWRQKYGWDGSHLHYFTLPLLIKLLKEGGFSIESYQDAGANYQFIRSLLPELLFGNLLVIASKNKRSSIQG